MTERDRSEHHVDPWRRIDELEAERERLEAALRRDESVRTELERQVAASTVEAAAARRQLTSVFERVTDAFVALDRDWRYTYVNAQAGKLFGRRPEELVGKHIWTEFPEGVGQPFHRAYERALAEQRPIRLEEYFAPWDRWFENVIYPSLDGVSIYFHDVTEAKRVEAALRESELRYRTLFDAAGDAIFLMREDRFVACNRRTLALFACRREEIVGAEPYRFSPPTQPDGRASREAAREWIERARTGAPQSFDWVHCRADGAPFAAEVSLTRLDLAGETLLQAIVRDVTERKRAEEQVRQLNAELRRHAASLEEKVRARTAELAARNQELKDFAYTVSHDLKAPLRGIAGYAGELTRKHQAGLTERAHFCLSQILTATAHLDQLIEDLLRYSRLDAETPSPADVELGPLVAELLRDRELLMTERGVEVTLDVPPLVVTTWERGLSQVLANLVDNALKYARASAPPRLRIAAEARDDTWRITVADNGIGFDMRYHDRIFGLFNRLVRAEDYEGTGAGLAIVRKLLDKQGGRIWAESTPGQGATFFVELPRPRDAE